MAIFGNFKGTTVSDFKIGKSSGNRISTGTVPSSDLTAGDLFIDSSNTSIKVYTGSAWSSIGSTLTDLNVDSGTLSVDSTNDTVSIGSTSSNEKLFVNGSLRLGTNPSLQHSGAYLDLRHSNGSGTVIRVRDNSSGTDPVFKVYDASNSAEVFKVQGNTIRINDAYNMPTADGTANQILATDGSGSVSFVDNSATPGGANTQIQFNDSGSFGGHANLTFDSSTETFSSPNISVDTFTYSVLSEDYGTIGETVTITRDYGSVQEDANEAFLTEVVEDETPQLGGDLDLNTNNITGTGDITNTGDINTQIVTATSYKDTVFTITDSASVDIDPDNGGIQVWTLGASRTPTANNFDAGAKVMLMIADGSSYSITWPSVNWVGGVAPTLPTTGYGIVELWKVGTQLYGAFAGGVA